MCFPCFAGERREGLDRPLVGDNSGRIVGGWGFGVLLRPVRFRGALARLNFATAQIGLEGRREPLRARVPSHRAAG